MMNREIVQINRLYHIMERLLQAEYGLLAGERLLHRLEETYSEEDEPEEKSLCYIMSTICRNSREQISELIQELDEGIIEQY